MEVKTVEETSLSLKKMTTYATITGLLVVGILLPIPYVEGYGSVLNTVLLVGLIGLVGRTLLSAVLAFSRADPPEINDDAALPTVSVVIPAYNEEPVLPGTVEACKQVDYPEEKLEVVLCYEAGSTDRTAEIAQQAADDDPRFVAVERDEPGGGKAKATNYALKHATGDIIASIDADHQFKPNAIRRAVAWFLADDDTWCVKGRCYGHNPTDSLLALHATVERHIAEKADLFAREVVDGFTIFGGGQAFFRAEVFDELGEFDEEILVEDIDMSSKIHQFGKELHVDPQVITYEENPATLSAWWNQRKRWARGWMQVAVRYLPLLPQERAVSTRKKIDAVYTFVYAILPVLFILVFPMPLFNGLSGVSTTTLIPNGWAIWTFISIAPIIVSYIIFLQDWRDGESHHLSEYIAAFTLWPYLVFQSAVFVAAFIDEFILDKDSIYVTTSRSDQSQSHPR
ncbi:glycosyltransferase [Halocatena pleomorpha]|uniref:Glycosyltransferase family 2 protein n=1 Tax=Halocatena pleomorpha TaxID=1785090 RepID=A0A3P3RHK7_9EURY|nr:glycosyltransferase family 2 protein [Halocatena pleomorpha]RRJ32835.1 glycosyltransferase family 2 protein [Halocatena pleomorpha]